ncbi:MAG TPA: cytochrome c maturation protein CcmE [Armatimonadota bacterium]|jgi:cytochrome c-type biogenesis protein CcmE
MKLQFLAGAGLVAGFVVFGMGAFKTSLTPYVSFAEARASTGGIQVAGAAVKKETRFDSARGELVFPMVEKKTGERIMVAYEGPKPASFDQADQVVAIGRYEGGQVRATRLLVKCPSKYNKLEAKPEVPSDKAALFKRVAERR